MPEVKIKNAPKTPEEYLAKYQAAKVLQSKKSMLRTRAELILGYREIYEDVEREIGVPWYVVACIHSLENGKDVGKFKAVLHNGEPIVGTGKRTTIVPKGRGPFESWSSAAIDALGDQNDKDWDLGSALAFLEKHNGLGYRKRNIASPYLWSMTDQYKQGHFIADGKFDPEVVSKNWGASAILKTLEGMSVDVGA